MAIEVFPTANDIGGSGTGRTGTEENMVQTLDRYSTQSSILSGMTLPASAADLDLEVAAGRAWIDGYLVRFPAAETVTITASSTVYLWLQLTGAGDSPPAVTATAWVETATLTNPGNAALVGEVTTSGSAITGTNYEIRRQSAGYIISAYDGDNTSSQDIALGATPRRVNVTHMDGADLLQHNSAIWPGNATLPTTEEQDLLIIDGGFRAFGASAERLNDGGVTYYFQAWF